LEHASSAAWAIDPYALGGLLLSLLVYAGGTIRLWTNAGIGSGIARWRATAFLAGWSVSAAAVLSPLSGMADLLFSAHMTQHELLMLVAAPLIALGHPGVAALWSLPAPSRRAMATAIRRVRRPWRIITSAAGAFLLHALVIWLWHIPAWFGAALASDALHAVQHASMLGTAALFWWSMMHGRFGRAGYGASVMFVFVTALHTGGLGAVLTMSPAAWYPEYVATARAWNVDALADQQLAGLLMWVPSGLIFIVLGLALFAAWIGDSERRTPRHVAASGNTTPPVIALALACIASWALPVAAGPQSPVTIRVVGTVSPDVQLGMTFGETEARATLQLLRRPLAITRKEDDVRPDVVIAGANARLAGRQARTPVLVLGTARPGAGPCEFFLVPGSARGGRALLWDASLERFGAGQLNERFVRAHNVPMNSDHWLGWFAVKVAVETAVKPAGGDRCGLAQTLRFDGHKGTPLTFDTSSRELLQPVYARARAADGAPVLQEVR
jgi:cytochrome c oxidase assembly factor CtaG